MQVQPVLQVEDIIRWSSQPPGQLSPRPNSTVADASGAGTSSNSNDQTLNPKTPATELVMGIPPSEQVADGGVLMEDASRQVPDAAVVREVAAEEVVLMVDSVDAVVKMRERVMRSDVVGFDCEWKPKRDKGWEENEVRAGVNSRHIRCSCDM